MIIIVTTAFLQPLDMRSLRQYIILSAKNNKMVVIMTKDYRVSAIIIFLMTVLIAVIEKGNYSIITSITYNCL